jgi:hypothetical protein
VISQRHSPEFGVPQELFMEEHQLANDIVLPPTGENPGDASSASAAADHEKSARQRRKGRLLSEDDCRRMLSELPTLVILKLISPAQANAMTRTLQVLLNETRASQSAGPAQVDENLFAKLRSQPELLTLMEPYLSDDHVDRIMRDA